MNTNDVIKHIKNHRYNYTKGVLIKTEKRLREDSRWNMIRFRSDGLDLYQSMDYSATIKKHTIYTDQFGRQHLISKEDFLILDY